MKKNKDWNFTVRCINQFFPGEYATLNKIYEVKDGIITFDDGYTSACGRIKNIEFLNRNYTCQFELVEKSKKSELKKKIKELESDLESVSRWNSEYMDDKHRFDFKIGKLIIKVKELESELRTEKITSEALRKQVEQLTKFADVRKIENKKLIKECAKHKQRCSELQVAVDKRNKRIKRLHEALDKTRFPTWVDKLFDVDEKRKKQLKAIRSIQNKKIAIHCDTREKEIVFVDLVREAFGYGFHSAAYGFDVYASTLCRCAKTKILQYGDTGFYRSSGYTIIKFEDLETFADTIEV